MQVCKSFFSFVEILKVTAMSSKLKALIITAIISLGIGLIFFISAQRSSKDFSRIKENMTVAEVKRNAGNPAEIVEIPILGIRMFIYKQGVVVVENNRVVNIMSGEEFTNMSEELFDIRNEIQSGLDEWEKMQDEFNRLLDNL